MTTVRNFTYAGGEVSPSIYSRPDLIKNGTGARKIRNFQINRTGALANRPGTQFTAELNDSLEKGRLIPFIFNDLNAFVLAFNAQTMRVLKNGAQLKDVTFSIVDITQASPAVVTTSAPHGLTGSAHEVLILAVLGMIEINNRNLKLTVTGATTFSLQNMDGSSFDTTGFTAYVGPSGTAAHVFEITTPYLEADLPDLRFAQSADVMTIVHPSHFVRELRRLTDTSWTLTIVEFRSATSRPTGLATAGSVAGALNLSYIVTRVNELTGEESGAGMSDIVAISTVSKANPAVVTAAAPHTFLNGEEVIFEGVSGMPEIRNRTFIVSASATPVFEINEDTTLYTTEAFTLLAGRRGVNLVAVAAPTVGVPITVSWTTTGFVPGFFYRIYRRDALDGVYGFIGESRGSTFVDDDSVIPDILLQPNIERVPFFKAGLFPAAVTHYQGRRVLGGSNNQPERAFAGLKNSLSNFYTSVPELDTDTVVIDLVGQKVSRIKHFLDLGTLVVFSSSIEWIVRGDADGILTPTQQNQVAQSYQGSSGRRPLIADATALFLQNRGTIVRDLGFDVTSDKYKGNELTIFADHLVDDFTIDDWDYAQVPHSIIWAVRSDGVLLGLTYIPAHEIFGWHTHDWSGGTVENVAVIPEGNEDRTYVTIKRTINGRTTRYVERFNTRKIIGTAAKDMVFVDSALTFDGRNVGSTTMTVTGGPPWTTGSNLILTASLAIFTLADVGKTFVLRITTVTIVDGLEVTTVDEVRFGVYAFTSSTIVLVRPKKDVPLVMRGVATTDWDEAVVQVSGLHHIEGKTVSILADGGVQANPNNTSIALKKTVTGGIITLATAAAVVHVGLPITADLETLDIDSAQSETMVDKAKNISKVTVWVRETRGLWAGPADPGTDVVDGTNLDEFKLRQNENYGEAPELKSEPIDVRIRSQWNNHGRAFLRQTDPVPAEILSVARSGFIPFRGGGV